MLRWIVAAALSLCSVVAAARGQQPAPAEALDGVDVVALLATGKEVFGKSAHRSTHEGFVYLFASPEAKAAFDLAPAKYAIQFGGLCARMGGTVTANPSNYLVHDGRIYIFASDTCRTRFLDAPARYIPRAAPAMPETPAAIARGRAILDRAAAAHGGTALDAVTSYVETTSTVQKRPAGDATIVTRSMWRFPDGARTERTIPLAAGPMTMTTVLTPAGAWGLAPDGASRPVPPAALPAVQASMGRNLLSILKSRADAAVRVAALEPATVEGTAVERVRVVRGGLDITLHVEAATGRAHSLAFAGRGDQGDVGEILLVFGDFRPVKGITLPFEEKATFNGALSVSLSRTLDTADVDVPLDAALFVVKERGGQ
jgi:YHS domain-containing protein